MNLKMKHLMTALIASAAVGQAVHAQEASSAVAQDTKQVEQAADGMANKVAGWLDKLSDSVRTLGEKSEEWSKDAATYKDQLKEQWPSIKEQFNQKLSEGMEKGQQSKEAVSKWLDDTFSQERINKAEEWMTNFKNGVIPIRWTNGTRAIVVNIRSPLKAWIVLFRSHCRSLGIFLRTCSSVRMNS